MIYKRYELSLSLNGEQLVHIARNASGMVVFRENSEKALKRAIDEAIKEQEYQDQLAEERRLEKENKRSLTSNDDKKKKVVEETVQEEPEQIVTGVEEVTQETETLIPAPKSVTRGPDGKFISKSQLDTDEDLKKKTFWDKLTS